MKNIEPLKTPEILKEEFERVPPSSPRVRSGHESPLTARGEFNTEQSQENIDPPTRKLLINAVKFDLNQLFDAIETARQQGIRCSVLIPVNGTPTLQVEE